MAKGESVETEGVNIDATVWVGIEELALGVYDRGGFPLALAAIPCGAA